LLPEDSKLGSLSEDLQAGRRTTERSRHLVLRGARQAPGPFALAFDVGPDGASRDDADSVSRVLHVNGASGDIPDADSGSSNSRALDVGSDGTSRDNVDDD